MAYVKQTWQTGQTVTANKLNHIEDGIAAADTALTQQSQQIAELQGNYAYVEDDTLNIVFRDAQPEPPEPEEPSVYHLGLYNIAGGGVITAEATCDCYVVQLNRFKTVTITAVDNTYSSVIFGYYADAPVAGSVAVDSDRHVEYSKTNTLTVPDGVNYIACRVSVGASISI